MDAREQKGLQIAATVKLWKASGVWKVPSQSGGSYYVVNHNGTCQHCTCPDHASRGVKCKHLWAVEYTMQREFTVTTETETKENGETVTTRTETEVVTKKVTYKQNWPAYNAAQTNEKPLFLKLLSELCSTIEEPAPAFGRPPLPLRDMIFCAGFKTYSTVSCRRFVGDLEDAVAKGFIAQAPHYNSIFNYLETENTKAILLDLIEKSSLPLASLESDFAIDSSGFSSSRFVKWFDVKHNGEVSTADWVKLHLMTGVKTNIVSSVKVTGKDGGDSPQLAGLVEDTAKGFTIKEVSADKAYSGHKNLLAIEKAGAVPYIPFKSNATGEGLVPSHAKQPEGAELWKKMYHYYAFQKEEFLQHYHKRSNCESTFSMIKAKFGDAVRSRTETAQINEVLLKVLCHNICVLIQSIFELGIEPIFCTKSTIPAQ